VLQKNPLAIAKSDTQGGLSNRVNVQEAKEFKVTVELLDKEMTDEIRNALRPGMSATATITTKVKNNVTAVPLESIVEKSPSPSPTASVASTGTSPQPADKPKTLKGVYIIEGNKVRFIEVTTGITGEADIEITSGVKSGMEIIRGPSRVLKTLKDGMTVKRQTKPSGSNANANGA
jgi:HlyD family secretion protein